MEITNVVINSFYDVGVPALHTTSKSFVGDDRVSKAEEYFIKMSDKFSNELGESYDESLALEDGYVEFKDGTNILIWHSIGE